MQSQRTTSSLIVGLFSRWTTKTSTGSTQTKNSSLCSPIQKTFTLHFDNLRYITQYNYQLSQVATSLFVSTEALILTSSSSRLFYFCYSIKTGLIGRRLTYTHLIMQSKPSKAVATVFSLLLCALTPVLAQDSSTPSVAASQYTYSGCYSSSNPLSDQGSWTYQSPGYCQQKCVAMNKPVMGTTKGLNCWCGDLLPDASSKVSDPQCNTKCQGFDKDMCKF